MSRLRWLALPLTGSLRPRTGGSHASQQPGVSNGPVLTALRNTVGVDFEVLGELVQEHPGVLAYLARERATGGLVGLRLELEAPNHYMLDIVRELPTVMAGVEARCPRCAADAVAGARFCTRCGSDLSEIGLMGRGIPRAGLPAGLERAAAGKYEILGELAGAEGGPVYCARERGTSGIVALCLWKDAHDEYVLHVTRTFACLPRPMPPPEMADTPSAEYVPSAPISESLHPREPEQPLSRGPERRPARPVARRMSSSDSGDGTAWMVAILVVLIIVAAVFVALRYGSGF
jgi:hypothetical protein